MKIADEERQAEENPPVDHSTDGGVEKAGMPVPKTPPKWPPMTPVVACFSKNSGPPLPVGPHPVPPHGLPHPDWQPLPPPSLPPGPPGPLAAHPTGPPSPVPFPPHPPWTVPGPNVLGYMGYLVDSHQNVLKDLVFLGEGVLGLFEFATI